MKMEDMKEKHSIRHDAITHLVDMEEARYAQAYNIHTFNPVYVNHVHLWVELCYGARFDSCSLHRNWHGLTQMKIQ